MRKALAVSLVVALLPLAASAATISYSVDYVGSYDNDTNWTPIGDQSALLQGLNLAGYDNNWVHELQVKAAVSGLASDEDLHRMGLAIDLDKCTDTIGWFGSTAQYTYDPPGPPPPVTANIFSENADGGTSATDLKAIIASITANAAWQTQFGETGAELVGTVYVKWDNSAVSTVSADGDPPTGSSWVLWTANSTGGSTTIAPQATGTSTAGEFVFGVPEPATLALMAVGSVAALIRRRR